MANDEIHGNRFERMKIMVIGVRSKPYLMACMYLAVHWPDDAIGHAHRYTITDLRGRK